MTDVVVVMRLAGDDADASKQDILALLEGVAGADVTDSSVDAALGMTAKELVLTVTISFATSVSANFATKAIEDALQGPLPDQVTVEEIFCETPSENDGTVEESPE
ncbi:MAG: hypothetical protein AAGK37_17105 [Pseudomonadota bacterium]